MNTDMAIALIMSVGTIGPAIAIGLATAKGLEAIGRNPEASSRVQTNMILGLAFAEAIAIYALLVSLILKFA
jgi:F-type H+-transporting ATPase subunit c